jgi:hypothetical protein
MPVHIMIKRILNMIVHYVIYAIMASLSLVAVYAAAMPIYKKTITEEHKAE